MILLEISKVCAIYNGPNVIQDLEKGELFAKTAALSRISITWSLSGAVTCLPWRTCELNLE